MAPIRKRTAAGQTRSAARTTADAMVRALPDYIRGWIAGSDPLTGKRHADRWLEALMRDVDDGKADGHRTAMGIFPRVAGAVGQEEAILRAMLDMIGAETIEEAVEAVAFRQRTNTTTVAATDARGIAYFKRRMAADKGFRAHLREALFGETAVDTGESET